MVCSSGSPVEKSSPAAMTALNPHSAYPDRGGARQVEKPAIR